MAATSYSFEFVCRVPPARMFKACVLDKHNLTPKIMPQVVSSAELIQGDGGVGSVKHMKFTDVIPSSHFKERVDFLDKVKLEYKYTVIDGTDVGTKLASAFYDVKFVPSGNGGCVIKTTAVHTPLAGLHYTDEEAQVSKEGLEGMYEAVEAHQVENPDAYA